MNSISFGNLTTNAQTTPELEQRMQSQENFTAIDKEKLKQDTVELTSKAQNVVKENFIFRALRNIGVEDPKKTLKSIAYTAITVIGVAVFGNKFSNKFAELGLKVDDLVKKSNFLTNVGQKLSNGKKAVSKFLKGRKGVIGDVTRTLTNKAERVSPKSGWAIASVAGPKYQFASAVIESFQGIFYGKTKKLAKELIEDANFKKAFGSASRLDKEVIRKIVSGELTQEAFKQKYPNVAQDVLDKLFKDTENKITNKAQELLGKIVGNDNACKALNTIVEDNADNRVIFVDEFIANIRKNIGKEGKEASKEELLAFFEKIQKGERGFEDCKDINMIHGFDSWCTTNWIDKLGKKIFKDKWKNVSKANVGSTLIKYSATTGKLADTAAGKFVQGFPTIFTESVSNYVCDMAFINAVVIPSFIDLYNNVQDAPKEQKVATLADEFVAGVGNFTLVMPAAGAITYGLASLRNLEGKSLLSKPLKWVGKLFGLGLPGKNIKTPGKIAGFAGGLFRCIMIMGVLNTALSKPISKVVHKIFGKPYNKEEALKAQQLEEQKKQIIPELGITQGELMEKMQKNPEALQKLQTDEKLAYTIAQNPKALLDLLDNKDVQYIEPKPTPASQGTLLSPANQARMGNSTNVVNKKQETSQKISQETTSNKENEIVDTATYIPSSAFTAPKSTLSKEQLDEYNSIMTKADKALAAAEKYI